jgi:predicted membrane-bound spermidine synthase
LVLVGLLLLSGRRQAIVGIFIFLISLAALPSPALPQNVILETESAYNQIRLVQENKLTYLTLNSSDSVFFQSVYVKGGTLLNISLLDLFNIGAEITTAESILVLGMAIGASIRQFQQYFPEAKIDAVEIDPKIVRIAREKFGINENEKLEIYIDDARPFLARTEKKYDLVEVDLFQGSPYIPFYVLTREFFESVENVLSDNGVMVINICAPGKREILEPVLTTIAKAFPSVYKIPVGYNFLVLATKEKTKLAEIKEKIKNSSTAERSDLVYINEYSLVNIVDFVPDEKIPIFTDDWAPVEAITYKMIKGLNL